MKVLVTGGAGFIGSAVIRYFLRATGDQVVNVDKLTYAGDLRSLESVSTLASYAFERADICDAVAMRRIFAVHQPDAVMHLAAESHVDRSIDRPADFIQTNVFGTYTLLEAALAHWSGITGARRDRFRFLHVSTDEVFGDLGEADPAFTEATAYAPSSPYSASKAASDHLVRAWRRTFGLPIVLTNCSNNYGPYQFPEKLIPLTILNALEGKALPVYGRGENLRDWLYVEDHARALCLVLSEGRKGETYNIGGNNEMRNIDVVCAICKLLETLAPEKPDGVRRYEDLISFVEDRPGHDRRYAMNSQKIQRTLGWQPQESFTSGLRKTVTWYLDNREWAAAIRAKIYDGGRLGTARNIASHA